MLTRQRTQPIVLLFLVLLSGLGARSANAANHRLSLPPHAAFLLDGASVNPSGYNGALNLPPNGNPGFAMGFTLPEDYKVGTPLTLAVIADSSATGCGFTMQARALVRARAGAAADLGGVHAGLEAVAASTPFSFAEGRRNLNFAATTTAFVPLRFSFRIVPTLGEFGPFEPGDAILFGLARLTSGGADTCDAAFLSVDGVSIVYQRVKKPLAEPQGRLSLDPFTAFGDGGDPIVWDSVHPPLRLSNNESAESASFGFVVPEDQKPNTPVALEFLWSTAGEDCSFEISNAFLFRSRVGRDADHKNANAAAGLEPVSASTPFVVLDDENIEVAAPAEPGRVARLTFRIVAGGGFPALRPGDAVSFGIFRRHGSAADTCTVDFAIAGASVVYERAPQPRAEAAKKRRISFQPYSLDFDALVPVQRASGFAPALRFPGGSSALDQSDFATGFVLPEDYKPNSAITVEMLFVADEKGCDFRLIRNGLFRARPGHPRDFGNAGGGLEPSGATTAHSVSESTIVFAAPSKPGRTGRVEFEITPTPGEFPTLRAGDAVNFGIFRRLGDLEETCHGDLGLAGVAVVYTAK